MVGALLLQLDAFAKAPNLHPVVKIAEDPDGASDHDEQDEPGEQDQLEIFPLLAFVGEV